MAAAHTVRLLSQWKAFDGLIDVASRTDFEPPSSTCAEGGVSNVLRALSMVQDLASTAPRGVLHFESHGRFRHETKAVDMASLPHPGIPALLDVEELDALGDLARRAAKQIAGGSILRFLTPQFVHDAAKQHSPFQDMPGLVVEDEAHHLGASSEAFQELVTRLQHLGSGKTNSHLALLLISVAGQRHRRGWEDQFIASAFDGSRFVRRHLRALVERMGQALREHRDRLNAQECRGRVHLRTPLQGALTRKAPPTELPVRLLQVKAGDLVSPPMLLAA
ncbi:hypothetical protein [Streptomyces sp. NPDC001404]|uniref:hypothetical protein n=1 Tax=Streptomyces sp. NPDC001404 TaxID=3364571 RepID=UPI003687F370